MRRSASSRSAAVLAIVAAVALVLGACTSNAAHTGAPVPSQSTPPPPDASHPNIVFVLTDDLATNLVRYMPHVRALAARGASFGNYFVVDSLCCPSRSAIFTGQYPHDDGVFTNTAPDGGYVTYNRKHDPAKSFAVALHAAGYRTAFMGKYLNGYQPIDGSALGWDVWDGAGNGYPEFNYRLDENGVIRQYGSAPRDYLTDVLARKAADFIAAAPGSGRPFALEVSTFAPHQPYVPAPRDARSFAGITTPRGPAFDRLPTHPPGWLAHRPPLTARQKRGLNEIFRRRVQSVQAVDRLVARLEETLTKTGQLANTYFVFSSDNGYHLGEHRLTAGKQTAFDTDIRVPLVVAGPGVPAGERVHALASSIDLAPTFLDIAGAHPTDRPDGVSLTGLLHTGSPAPGWQRAVLVEHHGPVLTPGDPDLQTRNAGDPPSYEAMRTARFVYVEYATGAREYYDLTADPYELHNLAGTLSATRRTALHRALAALAECHGAAECQLAASTGALRH